MDRKFLTNPPKSTTPQFTSSSGASKGARNIRKHKTKPNWPLPPYAVFRCRAATPWIIPQHCKELEIGAFFEDFHQGFLPPQEQSEAFMRALSGHSSKNSDDDSLDANILNQDNNFSPPTTPTTAIISEPSSPTTPPPTNNKAKPPRKARLSKARTCGLPGALPDNFLY